MSHALICEDAGQEDRGLLSRKARSGTSFEGEGAASFFSPNTIMQKYLVEFAGTLFFLYVILATGSPWAIGAALAIAIALGGGVSGGNYNPAVTIMMVVAGRQPASDIIPYISAQVAGGLVALELYKLVKA